MTGAFRELPFDPDDSYTLAARAIIDAMGLDLDEADLVHLLRDTREAHRLLLGDWLRRNDPDWIFPRRRPRGRGLYDYGDDAGEGLEDWPEWWASIWGRARANPGRFRGTDIAKPPLVAIYYIVNEWWRRTIGTAFRPDFRAIDVKVPDAQNMPLLNDAARLFLLVAQDADPSRYNCDLCYRVHDANYRRLDTTIP